jgi:hypothetical protein
MSLMPRQIPLISAALMSLVAMMPGMPYSYFMLLRIVMCGVMLVAAWGAYERKKIRLSWICVIVAILFNPVLKVHLTRECWWWLDVVAAAWCMALVKMQKI